ncbi:MAG: zinc ribbon domain-containing protein [Frateuria sp.]|nr:zinc ribbon domain-containing protein [Frateuria sp.]
MALVTCTECGAAVSDRATVCPKCGAPPRMQVANPYRVPFFVRASLWVFGAIGALIVLSQFVPDPSPEERAASEARMQAERVIDVCWDQQERKSMSPEGQRFIAGACEIAEQDYLRTYGHYYKRYGKKP